MGYNLFIPKCRGDWTGIQPSLRSEERMAMTTNFAPDTDTDQAVHVAGVFPERLMAVDCVCAQYASPEDAFGHVGQLGSQLASLRLLPLEVPRRSKLYAMLWAQVSLCAQPKRYLLSVTKRFFF